jgi:uncharacterized tellurite resistance protein B-like protein
MEFPTEALKLAFSYHALEQIIAADGVLEPGEIAFLQATFSDELMREAGYFDANGERLPRYAAALEEALVELPDRLTLGEKLCLIEIFAEATVADGVLKAVEADVLSAAAEMLGVTTDEWTAHLSQMQRMWRSGD